MSRRVPAVPGDAVPRRGHARSRENPRGCGGAPRFRRFLRDAAGVAPGRARIRILLAAGALALLAPGIPVLSAWPDAGSAAPIRLRSGVLRGPGDDAGLPPGLRMRRADLVRGGPALLRLSGPLTAPNRAAMTDAGVEIAGHLGDGAVIVWLPSDRLGRVERLPQVEWAAPFHPGLRISPAAAAVKADDPRKWIPLTLYLFAHVDAAGLAPELEAMGLRLGGVTGGRSRRSDRAYRPGRIVALPSPRQWVKLRDRIARRPELLWIDLRPRYGLWNDSSAWVGQSGLNGGQTTPVHDHGILGQGQVIGILDTGLDADLCFFRDDALGLPPTNLGLGFAPPDETQRKVTMVNFLWSGDDPADPTAWDDHDHGTHVAGSAAGDDLASPGVRDAGDGMAPGAKLVIQDGGFGTDDCADLPAIGCPAADLYPFFQQAYLQGARIHSNSYGDRENFTPHNIYSDGSEAADAFMWDNPDMLLVFAAGNDGPQLGTVTTPATGKNVLAVGATNPGVLAGTLAVFSSRGPTHDGRIKPDLTAPGSGIVSANSDGNVNTNNCGTRSMSGTSMATPTAAGLAALVREYYTAGYHPTGAAVPADAILPSAALVKATLIASAEPMENLIAPPPTDYQGWGRILLDNALYFAGEPRRLFAADAAGRFQASTDPTDFHGLQVLDSAEPLRVILAWTDYPSNPAATANLVNDLDLEVESPSGAIYLGNVFSNGFSVTGGTADDVNNIEAVFIEEPEAGSWTVRVVPATIAEPAQGYALVATGRLPAGGVLLEREGLAIDDSVGGNGNGQLEPGEWADLLLDLLNGGDTAATNVLAGVESLTAGVEAVQAPAPVPDLLPGQVATSGPPRLRIHLAADRPCNEPVTLRFSYGADGYQRTEETALPGGVEQLIVRDDLEGGTGWQHRASESTASDGAWTLGDPNVTEFQPGDDATPDPGNTCLFTAYNIGDPDNGDVDGGTVVARSGSYDVAGYPEARLRISRWFANRNQGSDPGDFFRLEIRESPAGPDVLLEQLGYQESAPAWTEVEFRLADYLSSPAEVELKVSAADGPASDNTIEAAIDEIEFWQPACQVYNPPPNPVATLAASLSGTDVILDWTRPAPDPLHGEADRYGIYRSGSPVGGFALLHELLDSSAEPQYTDLDAADLPPLRFYQVIAGNDAGDAESPP